MSTADQDLRRLIQLAQKLVDETPARSRPGSPRRSETDRVRKSRGGGRERASLLDRLNVEAQVMVANLCVIIDAVADCFQVAALRADAVNGPGLSFAVRPAMEVAGQVAWLLDDGLDGEERARRYLVWRFNDLKQQRLLLFDFRPQSGVQASKTELDAVENGLLDDVSRAQWQARPTVVTRRGDVTPAALLDADRHPERMPTITQLVRLVSSTPSVYGLLSVPAHGVRFGAYLGLESEGDSSTGTQRSRIGGFALDTNLLIGLTVLALNRSTRLLGGWNGLDPSRFHRESRKLIRRAGI